MSRKLLKTTLRVFLFLSIGLTLPATSSAGNIWRTFVNDTGEPVDDWHVSERNGKATMVRVTSSTPGWDKSTLRPGSPAAASAKISTTGTTIADAGESISVRIECPGPGLLPPCGRLDWQWSTGGMPVGDLHTDLQAIFASVTNIDALGFGDIVVSITNESPFDALYHVFEFGTLRVDIDYDSLVTDPGGLGANASLLIQETDLLVLAGDTLFFSVDDIPLAGIFGSYANASAGSHNYAQVMSQVVPVPEPDTFFLFATGLIGLFLCGWRRKLNRLG